MRIDVGKLYPQSDKEYFEEYDYQPMVDAFGKVVVRVDDHGYQGDSRVLYDEDGKVGILIFGWGSCHGCDALQACRNIKELQELCDSLQDDIKWFDNYKDALEYVKQKDWETEWYYHTVEGKLFVCLITKYLEVRGK